MAEIPAPTLYLIPSNLAAGDPRLVLPAGVIAIATRLDHFIAERAKTARSFLRAIGHPKPLRQIVIEELNEHTPPDRIPERLSALAAGHSCGLLAEAGGPAIADPGAPLIWQAHLDGIRVRPLVGPSAVLLALMASGLPGQRFAFHGYLPADRTERRREIARLEADSQRRDETEIFIETPYRNLALFESLIAGCAPATLLCVASDLTGPAERVTSRPVAAWQREAPPPFAKLPSVFLLYAGASAQRRG